jgi:hypothetical protein
MKDKIKSIIEKEYDCEVTEILKTGKLHDM